MPKGPNATPAGSGRGGRVPQRPPPRSASRRKRERRRTATTQRGAGSRSFWARRGVWAAGAAALAVVIAVVVVLLIARGGKPAPVASASPSATPTAAPSPSPTPLAPVSAGVTGQPIDGIQCQTREATANHVHAHLAIEVNGVPRSIPEGVGVAPPRHTVPSNEGPYVDGGKCFYWLHTHSADGIIHVEAPDQRPLTLGQFFDIWQQPLTTGSVDGATGRVIVYVNGTRFGGDPRSITITAHELIQIDVGTDVPPATFTFPPGL